MCARIDASVARPWQVLVHRRPLSIVLALLLATATLSALPQSTAVATGRSPILAKRIIGYSVDHRPIVAYHLGNPHLRRVSLLLGQMHGDEHAGVRLVDSILHGALSTEAVKGINLWVIPTMNPDGNAANTRQNAHHVDLNRNWPVHWAPLKGRYNAGPHPLSEPETRAMYRFLRRIKPHYFVSLHQPLDGVDTSDGGHVDPAFRNRLAHNLDLPTKALKCWSTCHGNMTRWYTARHYGIGITVEFTSNPSKRYVTSTAPRGIIRAFGGHFGRF
jgi:protein MpaA